MFDEFSQAVQIFVALVKEATDGCLLSIESGGYETHNPSGYMDKLTISRTPTTSSRDAEKMTYGRTIYGHYIYDGRESEERNDFLKAIKEVGRIFGRKLDGRHRVSFSFLKGGGTYTFYPTVEGKQEISAIREGFPD